MRQIVQSLRDGETQLVDVPCPQVRAGHVLIQTHKTLISAGTERMLQEFGKASLLGKARQQPEKVRQVLDKIRTDGLFTTLESVFDRLDEPIALGYCNVGHVLEVGLGVDGLEPGDRVLSNGSHAEVVSVPRNLCTRIPDAVGDDQAVFGVLGAIALQGIRLIQPTLGECVVVSGLGLVGLLAVELLQAHGVRVLGADFHPGRLKMAQEFGAEVVNLADGDLLGAAAKFSRGRGVDAVLITAATQSNEPIAQATQMCRKRGRIVLTGVCGMQMSRDQFFKKELTFQVSCSYGPGRYEPEYEERGQDYPAPYVRWTEQRNFEAVLDMLASQRITTTPLISHRFSIDEATKAYGIIGSKEPSLGVILEYGATPATSLRRSTIEYRSQAVASSRQHGASETPVVAFIGAGGFGSRVLMPAFQAAGARLKWVATRGGISGAHAARKFQIERATTVSDLLFRDSEVNTVVIATRHDTHADFVCQALAAGKHVFVEKPLAINAMQLDQIHSAYRAAGGDHGPRLMVGFNRRFAPHVQKMASLLKSVAEPKTLVLTVNAGAIPADHWTQHPAQGGGRIIGEGCHFIDLARFLCGHPITAVQAMQMGGRDAVAVRDDKMTITLGFADGSLATIHYFANGHRSFAKERVEVFCGGRVLQLDNFRRLTGYGWPSFNRLGSWKQDKGHKTEVAAFLDSIRTGAAAPIPWEQITEVTEASFDAVRVASPSATETDHEPVAWQLRAA